MYNEEQYIYETFTKNFIENKRGNIVLYGTGIHTAKLLEKLDRKQIAGLMDVKRTGEILWGYRVLSYEEVRKISDVRIVIIAREAVINTVYRRIEDFCRENEISVYDINGNNLVSGQIHEERHRCFLLERADLMRKIENADFVTFDIFDTLLTRKILSPQDVFRYMDDRNPVSHLDFFCERKKEEDGIQDKKNPTIYDIYDCLQRNTGISETEKELLLKWEIETEIRMLCRRESMCGILDYVGKLGKKVYLVSDMYLTGELIETILKAHQITNYDGIFVSCDYSVGKQEGLFQIVKKELAKKKFVKKELCPAEDVRILHIGDNFFSDIRAAKEAGFDTYQIFSPREMYERSIYSRVLPEPESMEEELVLGKFISTAFNDPFGKYKGNGTLIFDNAERVTELFIAPVILKYMLFLIQTVAEKQIDFIIFPSRDGYLLRRLFYLIEKTGNSSIRFPESIYFYTSRRAALIASAYTEQDIINILSIQDSRDSADMLEARFGIRMDKEFRKDKDFRVDKEFRKDKDFRVGKDFCMDKDFRMDKDSQADKDLQADTSEAKKSAAEKLTLGQSAPEMMERLLEICGEERKNYQNYIESLGISEYRLTAFVDFVAVGTVQSAIEKLIHKRMQGIYFRKRRSSEERYENLTVSSLYGSAGDFNTNANIYKFYYFLENILSSNEPSLMSVTDKGEFRFYKEERDAEEIGRLSRIHNSVEQYARDMMKLLPKVESCTAPIRLYDAVLGLLSKEYSEFDEEALFHMKNVDEFMGRAVTSMNR